MKGNRGSLGGGGGEGNRVTSRFRWEDNIKMYHKEAKWGDVHWINLAVDKDKW
jgi:hypothetical protein